MKIEMSAAIASATLLLAACGQKNEASDTATENVAVPAAEDNASLDATNAALAAPATGAQGFANTAAASDAFEIATSQLAQTASTSSAVKSYAQKMIDAHQKSTSKLTTAATTASPALTPDPTLTAEQQRELDDLKSKKGADFDRAYAAQQVSAHQTALDALRAYSQNGGQPSLKTFATDTIPTVTAHLNMAKALKP